MAVERRSQEVDIRDLGEKFPNRVKDAVYLLNLSLKELRVVDRFGKFGKRRSSREIRDILAQRRPQIIAIEDALKFLNHESLPSKPVKFILDDEAVLGFSLIIEEKRRPQIFS